MATNQFVARNGIISLNDEQITGSLFVSGTIVSITGSLSVLGGITGSFSGTSSFATSASYAATATVFPYTGSATITGSLIVTGSSFTSGSLNIASGSLQVDGGTLTTTYVSSEARIADGALNLMKTSAGGIFEAIRAMNFDTTVGTTVRLLAAATSDPFNNTNGGKVFIDAIRTATNMDLAFSLNNASGVAAVERVRFAGSGDVLIGTAIDSGYRLDVSGSGRFTGGLLVTGSTLLSGSLITTGSTLISGSINLNNNSAILAVDGTYGSPYYTLGFGGTANGSSRIFGGTGVDLFVASGTGYGINLRTNGGTTNNLSIASTGAATFSSNIVAGGGSDIGNATSRVVIANNTLTNTRGLGFYCNDGTQNPRTWINHVTTNGSQQLQFNSDFSAATTYASFAFLNGSVGIGTGSVSTGFISEIKSNTSYGLKISNTSNAQYIQIGSTDPEITSNGGANFRIGTNDSVPLDIRTNNTTRLTITNVGTSSFNGNVIVTGSVTATGGGFDSDLTLKNVLSRDLSLYYIANEVSPLTYTWKDETKGKTKRFGYGAQELQTLIPEAVYQNGGTLAVDYTQVHTVLIDENTKRIQELEKQVTELKNIINGLDKSK